MDKEVFLALVEGHEMACYVYMYSATGSDDEKAAERTRTRIERLLKKHGYTPDQTVYDDEPRVWEYTQPKTIQPMLLELPTSFDTPPVRSRKVRTHAVGTNSTRGARARNRQAPQP